MWFFPLFWAPYILRHPNDQKNFWKASLSFFPCQKASQKVSSKLGTDPPKSVRSCLNTVCVSLSVLFSICLSVSFKALLLAKVGPIVQVCYNIIWYFCFSLHIQPWEGWTNALQDQDSNQECYFETCQRFSSQERSL